MSTFRIDGLASNLNTTAIIDQLMAIERRPIQLLQQKQDALELRRDAWKDIASRLQNLETTAAALLQRSTLLGNTVRFDSASSAVSATATSNAVAGSYSVLVSSIATQTTARSTSAIGAEINTAALLQDANLPSAVTSGAFSINGISISVDPAVDSLDDVLARINAAGAGVTASTVLVDGRKRLQISANTPGGPIQLGTAGDTSNFLSVTRILAAPRSGDAITGTSNLGVTSTNAELASANLATAVTGTGTLTINGVAISYDANVDSLSNVLSRINASAAGVTATYDASTDRVSIRNKTTGSVAIGLADTGSLLSALGVTGAQTLGSNAAYSLDGGTTTLYSTSNTITEAIQGVTLSFSATTASAVSFSVETDTDGAVAAVKGFVEQYNSVLSFISDKTAYDATAKKANTLTGDSDALRLARSLRELIVNPAAGSVGTYSSLSQAGLSFGNAGSALGTTDTLKLDETKLRDALRANPEAVLDLFGAHHTAKLTTAGDIASVTGTPTSPPAEGHYQITSDGAGNLTAAFIDSNNQTVWTGSGTITAGETNTTLIPGLTLRAASTLSGAGSDIDVDYHQGVMTTFKNFVSSALGTDGILKLRQSSADSQIKRLDSDMQRLEDRVSLKEDRLVKQFAALERLLSQFQSQSAALSSQLSALNQS